MKPKSSNSAIIEVAEIQTRLIHFCVVGTSPMLMNRFSQKAWQQLLLPPIESNRASRRETLKHVPLEEFRGALYQNRLMRNRPTALHLPTGMFHKAIAQAALDVPGATKAKIERLTKVNDVTIDLYGIPKVFMAMVRNSDISRTPDVRTRPIFEKWAAKIEIKYVVGILTERTISNLLAAAGEIVGIGDWRGEKGGPYGAFRCCEENDAEYTSIIRTMGRAAQEKAIAKPVCYDYETEELLAWFDAEIARREQQGKLGPKQGKTSERRKPHARRDELIDPAIAARAVKGARGRNGRARA